MTTYTVIALVCRWLIPLAMPNDTKIKKGDVSMKEFEILESDAFGVFRIKDKIKEVQTIWKQSLDALKAQYIVIIVPTSDHIDNAHTIAQYIMYNLGADLVSIIDCYQISNYIETVIGELGYVILPHAFTEVEKGYIFEQLMKNNGS